MKRGFPGIDNAPSPPNNPKRGFMTIKSKVKASCNTFGFPDMSHKITPSIVLFNPDVPAVRLGVVRREMCKEQIPSLDDAASVYVSKGKSTIGTMTSPVNVYIHASIDTGTTTGDTTGGDLPRGVPLEQYWQAAKDAVFVVECTLAKDMYQSTPAGRGPHGKAGTTARD
jgi:hypothetical protein